MIIKDHLEECISRYKELEACKCDMLIAFEILKRVFASGGKLLICGNGGSASDSSHIAGELLKSFCVKREIDKNFAERVGEEIAHNLQGALPAVSLPDMVAINTAYANDCNPQYCFAQLVYGLGHAHDALLCISTSGNAENVNLAAKVAKAKGMPVIGLSGKTGGKLNANVDVCIRVPETETFKIQELHLPLYHALCLMLEQHFFEKKEC